MVPVPLRFSRKKPVANYYSFLLIAKQCIPQALGIKRVVVASVTGWEAVHTGCFTSSTMLQ